MKTAKKLGLTIRANLIIGFPHENRGDVFRTILYGLRLVIMGVDEVPLFLFSSYPGSELFREQVADGTIFIDDDYFFGLASLNSDFMLSQFCYNSLTIKDNDQVTIEFASSYRRYTTCIMRTVLVGSVSSAQRNMFNVVSDAILAMTDAAGPGTPLGNIDDAHRRVF